MTFPAGLSRPGTGSSVPALPPKELIQSAEADHPDQISRRATRRRAGRSRDRSEPEPAASWGHGLRPAAPTASDLGIQTGDRRQAAAEHDHVRVEEVDDPGKRRGEAALVARERRAGLGLACSARRATSGARSRCRMRSDSRGRAPRRSARSRCSRCARRRTCGGPSSAGVSGSGLWPHSPAIALAPTSGLPPITMPPPTPVPRVAPNTRSAPAAAPSIASDRAKQLASLAIATGLPRACARSAPSGLRSSQAG